MDLNWLKDIAAQLSEEKPQESTLLDILGISTRETVISNLLAYYLDENKPHGLRRLFLDSLLACMAEQGARIEPECFTTPYSVEREADFIDILLTSADTRTEDWAIIIENKIYHTLDNPLEQYWHSVTATTKQGVVVTLKRLKTTLPEGYINVTHQQWLQRVQKTALTAGAGQNSDWRHRVLYKDFMQAMEKNTDSVNDDPEKQRLIVCFQKNGDNIKDLLANKEELQNHIRRHIVAIFEKYGFMESGSKHFVRDNTDPKAPKFCFYLEDGILLDKRLGIYFELYDDSCWMGERLREHIAKYLERLQLNKGSKGSIRKRYFHLAYLNQQLNLQSYNSLSEPLQEMIGRFFKEVEPKVTVVNDCYWLAEEIQRNKSI